MSELKIAVVGATGAVGREMIKDLAESKLPEIQLGLFASPRSRGVKVPFRGRSIEVQAFSPEALRGTRYIMMSAGGAFSREHSRGLVAAGATVIDNSSAWRMDAGTPLVVPEVNPEALRSDLPQLIANPNCSTIQMVVALKPLQDRFGLDMVQVATYQSVSGTGQKGISELAGQLEAQMKFQDPEPKAYAQPILFNCLPGIDVFDAEGHCYEEVKMIQETRKILGLPHLEVLASTVRVSTFHSHGEVVHVRLKRAVSRKEVLDALRDAPSVVLVEEDTHKAQPTPRSTAGDHRVFISRVRLMHGQSTSHWLQFWNVADNLKKGAATNAVQILEKLVGMAH